MPVFGEEGNKNKNKNKNKTAAMKHHQFVLQIFSSSSSVLSSVLLFCIPVPALCV